MKVLLIIAIIAMSVIASGTYQPGTYVLTDLSKVGLDPYFVSEKYTFTKDSCLYISGIRYGKLFAGPTEIGVQTWTWGNMIFVFNGLERGKIIMLSIECQTYRTATVGMLEKL